MTDDSKFVLKWEIDNVSSLAPGDVVESAVLNKGGFEWKASLRQNEKFPTGIDFLLSCEKDKWRDWKCKADVKFVLHERTGDHCSAKKSASFDENKSICDFNNMVSWSTLTLSSCRFNLGNKGIVEIHIDLISSEGGQSLEPMPIDLTKFCSPCEHNNVTLIIGDKKLKVSKDYLAVHSPVLAALFYSNFAEKGKEEVELKDLVYEEFIDLLQLIFPVTAQINDSTLVHVLALADRFQIQQVLVMVENHLMASRKFSSGEKLLLSDQYRLDKLMTNCLMSYSTALEISALESTPEYAQFADKTKISILDRMMKLVKSSKYC